MSHPCLTGEAAKFGSPGYQVPEIKKMAAFTDREIDVENPQGGKFMPCKQRSLMYPRSSWRYESSLLTG